jgi:hypothetical protein
MKKRNLLFIPIFLVLLIVGTYVGIYIHAIFMDAQDWRDKGQRYGCTYDVEVTGLSGKEVQGVTVIMVPIPASKEGKFFTPPTQKDPVFSQRLMHELKNWPEQYRRGPYFENATEIFDDQKIGGNWTSFIAKTEKGYMLGFKTNETRLEDIDYSTEFVADYIDIFDPINNGSSILFPVENVTNISSAPYEEYTLYDSNPTYDTYVYLSNNLGKVGETVSFNIQLNSHNDPTEWPRKYLGRYNNLLLAKVNDTGYVKVEAIMGQEVPFGNNSLDVLSSQYAINYYENKSSHVVN